MIELLFLFTFWPWFMLGLLLLAFLYSSAREGIGFAALTLPVYALTIWFAYDVNPLGWLIENPGTCFAAIALYTGLGVIWSLFKWREWMLDKTLQQRLTDTKSTWTKLRQIDDMSTFSECEYFPSAAKPSKNKDRIISWIVLWPVSIFLFVFTDLLNNLFNRLWRVISSMYQKITDSYLP